MFEIYPVQIGQQFQKKTLFNPNYYVDISKTLTKLKLLRYYTSNEKGPIVDQ